ncbi:MAG: hypothetical protein R3E04_05165 [Sphingobium sp.]
MSGIHDFFRKHVRASAVGTIGAISLVLGYIDQAINIFTKFQSWQLQALGAALIVTFVVMVLMSFDKTHGRQRISSQSSGLSAPTRQFGTVEIAEPEEINIRPPTNDGRVFLATNIDPVVLMDMRKGKTSLHGDKAVEPYLDKWLRYRGKISDVTAVGESSTLWFQVESLRSVAADLKDNSVASILHIGDEIEIEGKIVRIRTHGIDLDEVEILAR